MSGPPSFEDLDLSARDDYEYDFVQAERVLKAMDFLRGEAGRTNIEEIVTMVDATFKLLVTTYHCILRYEVTKLPPSGMQ